MRILIAKLPEGKAQVTLLTGKYNTQVLGTKLVTLGNACGQTAAELLTENKAKIPGAFPGEQPATP